MVLLIATYGLTSLIININIPEWVTGGISGFLKNIALPVCNVSQHSAFQTHTSLQILPTFNH